MTPLPQEICRTHIDDASVADLPDWAMKYKYLNIGDTAAGIIPDNIIPDNTVNSISLGILLPEWADIVDDEVNYFLRPYHLERELETCLQIIGSMLKPRPKVKIRLVDDSECDREYISISLVSNRKNVSNMADYIYNCNIAIARSLPADKLQYFVITME
ncbi:MAG: hypothetical protein KAJ46_01330 [Sedimentisphaerales bacterium]|nr:hypothetical protein [Sedimentisphaerales bacterium]